MDTMISSNPLTALQTKAAEDGRMTRQEATEVAGKFEGIFVNLLLSRMNSSLSENGIFGEEGGSKQYESMFTSMLSEQICSNGPGLGIAEQLVADWARKGQIKDPTPPTKEAVTKEATNV